MAGEVKKGKVKLPKTKFFVEVRLYKTVKELVRVTKKEVIGFYSPEPYVIYPKLKFAPKLGTIHLSKYLGKEKLGVGYISHEALHATFDLAHKQGEVTDTLSLEDNDEWLEKLCWWHGYLVKEIVNWLNSVK